MLIYNFRIRVVLLLCSLALCFLGCALPVPLGSELSGFVPAQELQVVSLAREGMALFNASRFFEAESKFRKALYLDPSLDNVKFNLATTLERTELFEEAGQIYKELIRKDGEKSIYRAAYGRLLVSEGKAEAGRDQFIIARSLALLEDDEAKVKSLSQSIVTLAFGLGRTDEALCEAKALCLKNQNSESLSDYLRMLISSGMVEKASRELESVGAEVLPEDSILSLYFRTLILFALGSKEEALELSERVLAYPGIDSTIEFELRVVNMIIRYQNSEAELFESDERLGFLKVLDESFKASTLTSLYWSPQLLTAAKEMLEDPKIRFLTGEPALASPPV